MKHIVHIIPENSSSLDFTLPIFWKNSQSKNPEFKFSVIFFYLNKNAVLKHSKFYKQVAIDSGVTFYDLTDFLLLPVFLKKSIRKLYNYSSTDKIFISDPLNHFKKESIFWPFLLFKYLTQNYNLKIIVNTIKIKILNEFAKFILFLSFSFKRVTEKLNISTILFDNRGRKNFLASSDFFKIVDEIKIPVVLIPHGAHYGNPESEYVQFLPDKKDLPSYCRHWMPFKYGEPWAVNNTPWNQFKYVGYPGLDSSWLNYISTNKDTHNNQIKILFIIRRYIGDKEKNILKIDSRIVDWDEIQNPIRKIHQILTDKDIDFVITIKPHPKNSIDQLRADLLSSNIDKVKITNESIYEIGVKSDIIVSIHSTILLVCAAMMKPTILLRNNLHEKAVSDWPILKKIYNELSFYTGKDTDIYKNLLNAIRHLHRDEKKFVIKDKNHVYNFFTSESTSSALADLCTIHAQ